MLRKHFRVLMSVLLSFSVAMTTLASARHTLVAAADNTTRHLGVFLPGGPDLPQQIDAFADLTGGMPKVAMTFQNWANPDDRPFFRTAMTSLADRGVTPIITWEPYGAPLSEIANGAHDEYMRSFARDAAAWNRPLFLRFAHEMNGGWTPWGVTVAPNSPSLYIDAWRRMVDIFRSEGADDVMFVWSPNVDNGGIPFESAYPGDAYVDWLALDGYNFSAYYNEPWFSMEQVFASSYDRLQVLSKRPVMIAETASHEAGGDKAKWIRDGFLQGIPERMPNIQVVIWFNQVKETDWRVESSTTSLEAYREVVSSSLYKSDGSPATAWPAPTPTVPSTTTTTIRPTTTTSPPTTTTISTTTTTTTTTVRPSTTTTMRPTDKCASGERVKKNRRCRPSARVSRTLHRD